MGTVISAEDYKKEVELVDECLQKHLKEKGIDYILITAKEFHPGQDGTFYGTKTNLKESHDILSLVDYIRERFLKKLFVH